jgi:CO dehydrogenase maturation factor
VTILDMEASIEHLTRGTVRTSDVLLLVTEPYYRALETMGRMAPLARELGIPFVLAVANKVRSERDEAAIREYAARRGIVEIAGVVPYDERVVEADRQGRAVIDVDPTAPAVVAISALAETLVERVGAPARPGSG